MAVIAGYPACAGHDSGGNAPVLATAESSQIFAANRARGRIELAVTARGGITRRAGVREEGSLRVRFPGQPAAVLEAVIVNTAGGMAGGDRFDLDFKVGPGAYLMVGSVAAEKLYRSSGPAAEVTINLDVAPGAALSWLPQELIFFDRARLSRHIDVALAGDASVLIAEGVVFGRSAMGEQVAAGQFFDRWRLRRDGRLVFADALRLDGNIAARLSEPAVAGGNIALATLLVAPGDDAQAAAVRAMADRFSGEVGVSAWNGLMLMRLCAPDGASLRHDLAVALSALGRRAPQLWLT
jgi:urease accessory protein